MGRVRKGTAQGALRDKLPGMEDPARDEPRDPPANPATDRLASVAERHPRLDRAVIQPVRTIVARYEDDDVPTNAGALTYGAFLSIPPILILLASAVGFLIGDPEEQKQVVETIVDQIPGLEDVAKGAVDAMVSGKAVSGVLGLVGLLWAASGFASRLRHAFGIIFRTERTGLVAGRLTGVLTGVPLLAGVIVLAGSGGLVSGLRSAGVIGVALEWAAYLVTFAVTVGFFLAVFMLFTPARVLGFRDYLPGALAAAIGWTALELLGARYVDLVVARSSALYGALGAVFGLLAFLYVAVYALLLSGELSMVLSELRTRGTPAPSE